MSTYLVAVVVAPLISATTTTPSGVAVSTWAVARADNAFRLAYALDAGARVLSWYEGVFGVAFPLPELKMVALPDFAAGAMENWGCVTYRETALLANASTSSASELQRVTVVVAHELAHQWVSGTASVMPVALTLRRAPHHALPSPSPPHTHTHTPPSLSLAIW